MKVPSAEPAWVELPRGVQAVLHEYRAGTISAEVAVMQLLLAYGSLELLLNCLDRIAAQAEFAPLRCLAAEHGADLERTAALVASGLAAERRTIAAVRNQFDRAVALAPEAAVALYSLGAPTTLDRATAEIVAGLREWGLVGPDRTVLDIGCGIGRFETALASEVAAITGIDVSGGMIAEARRRCAGLANVSLRQCGGTDLGEFADRSFDLILAVDMFPYLVAADPAIAARHIADAARLLRSGGALAILNYSYRGELGVDRAEVAQLASAHGFVVERSGTRDLTLWDGTTFLLRKPAGLSVRSRRE